MCPAGAWPVAAAFDLETGDFRCAACTPDDGLFVMAAASQDMVCVTEYVRGANGGAVPRYRGFDANSGEETWRGDESQFLSHVPAGAVDRQAVAPWHVTGQRLLEMWVGGRTGSPSSPSSRSAGRGVAQRFGPLTPRGSDHPEAAPICPGRSEGASRLPVLTALSRAGAMGSRGTTA